MLKFQRSTPQEQKEAAKIQYLRLQEEERKQRIFNARFRKIGVDKEFLDRQVKEKKFQREQEEVEECHHDTALIRSSQLAMQLEKQEGEERRKMHREMEEYRKLYQKPEDRRDFDLNDPDALKKSVPPRAGGDDSKIGISSAQKFEGENLSSTERQESQKEQIRYWLEKQKKEREFYEHERREAEKAYQDAIASRDKRATTLDNMERECRRRLNEATARFNQALADEQEQRRRWEAAQDDEDKKTEIYNHVTGDFLMEAREQAESIRGPDRPLQDRYKGMSAEEIKVYRDGQIHQIREIQKMRMEEKKMNEDWDQLMHAHATAAHDRQREIDRAKMELNKKIAEENLRLAQLQKSQREYINRSPFSSGPTADFFEQFNRSTR
ncbi:RIB43A-like with coiled-coils protein 2 [Prorops nasuta]|uniref:RIB43A-like with coiled-coils protein 2 n=1 Tax=Prorops nasuta TaxID=863751 RepID=UPI0034CE639A